MKKSKKKEKHWFDRLPKVYQQLVWEGFKKEYPTKTMKELRWCCRLDIAFAWINADWDGCHEFFHALNCSILGVNNMGGLKEEDI